MPNVVGATPGRKVNIDPAAAQASGAAANAAFAQVADQARALRAGSQQQAQISNDVQRSILAANVAAADRATKSGDLATAEMFDAFKGAADRSEREGVRAKEAAAKEKALGWTKEKYNEEQARLRKNEEVDRLYSDKAVLAASLGAFIDSAPQERDEAGNPVIDPKTGRARPLLSDAAKEVVSKIDAINVRIANYDISSRASTLMSAATMVELGISRWGEKWSAADMEAASKDQAVRLEEDRKRESEIADSSKATNLSVMNGNAESFQEFMRANPKAGGREQFDRLMEGMQRFAPLEVLVALKPALELDDKSVMTVEQVQSAAAKIDDLGAGPQVRGMRDALLSFREGKDSKYDALYGPLLKEEKEGKPDVEGRERKGKFGRYIDGAALNLSRVLNATLAGNSKSDERTVSKTAIAGLTGPGGSAAKAASNVRALGNAAYAAQSAADRAAAEPSSPPLSVTPVSLYLLDPNDDRRVLGVVEHVTKQEERKDGANELSGGDKDKYDMAVRNAEENLKKAKTREEADAASAALRESSVAKVRSKRETELEAELAELKDWQPGGTKLEKQRAKRAAEDEAHALREPGLGKAVSWLARAGRPDWTPEELMTSRGLKSIESKEKQLDELRAIRGGGARGAEIVPGLAERAAKAKGRWLSESGQTSAAMDLLKAEWRGRLTGREYTRLYRMVRDGEAGLADVQAALKKGGE